MYLYLDTARLGQMCPEAQAADLDFACLAGEEAGSLYFDLFLRNGFFSLPPSLQTRYRSLSDWSGVADLKNRFKTAFGLPRTRSAFLASRSAQLMRLAARMLCLHSENILVTDMLWPGYRTILQDACRRFGTWLTTVAIRAPLLRQGITSAELTTQLANRFRHEHCDAALISAVTYQGVRMPVREISHAINSVNTNSLVIVDAAQAIGHTPLGLHHSYCDFLIAGCHKWLRAYHPLGLGFCARPSAEEIIQQTLVDMQKQGELDDPLLNFTTELETGHCRPFSETVNLAPLFTASAAVGRIWRSGRSRNKRFSCQIDNAYRAAEMSQGTDWLPVRSERRMRSGIIMLQAMHAKTRAVSPDRLRLAFRRQGVAISAYQDGLIRASLPPEELDRSRFNLFRSVLRQCS